MKEIGKIIFKMVKGLKLGLMVHIIQEIILMGKKKEKDILIGKMEQLMKENLILIRLMV